MKPILFTIGPFNVYSFGVFLALAFIIATFIIWKMGREDLKEEEYLEGFLMMSIISLLSGRLVYILFHWDVFGLNILKYILVRETPGLSLIGGVIGGLLYLVYYIKKKKYHLYHVLDVFSQASGFSLVLAKIGEQLGGGGFGRETDFFLGIKVIGLSGRRHPVELYESILFLLISVLLMFVYNKSRRYKGCEGLVFYLFLFILSLTVFLLEFLKLETVYLYGLSLKQITVLAVVIFTLKPLFDRIKLIRLLKKDNHI